MANEWHASEPKKISAQQFYKAALAFFEKMDTNTNQTVSGSDFLKYIQETKKTQDEILKLARTFNNSNTSNNTKAVKDEVEIENKKLIGEKRKLEIQAKEDKIKIEKEYKERKLQLDAEEKRNNERRKEELHALKLKKAKQAVEYDKARQDIELKKLRANEFKESIPYKTFSNIVGQKSNTLSASILSMMTGINPLVLKTLGIDKLLTATTKFGGRLIGKGLSGISSGLKKTGSATLNAISGLGTGAIEGLGFAAKYIGQSANNRIEARHERLLKQQTLGPITDPSRLLTYQPQNNGILNSLPSIANNGESAAARDRRENDPQAVAQKNTLSFVEKIYKAIIGKKEEKPEEKKKSIFEYLWNILKGIGSFFKPSNLLKWLGLAAIGKALGKAFDTVIHPIETLKKVFNGLANSLSGIWNKIKNFVPNIGEKAKNVGAKIATRVKNAGKGLKNIAKNPKALTRGALTAGRAVLASPVVLPLAALTAGGYAGYEIEKQTGAFSKIFDNLWFNKKRDKYREEYTKYDLSKLPSEELEKLKQKAFNKNNEIKNETKSQKSNEEKKPVMEGLKVLTKNFKDLKFVDLIKAVKSNTKALLRLPLNIGKALLYPITGTVSKFWNNKEIENADANGGGYGTLGPISNSKNGMLHGIPVVGLKDLGLRGNIVSSNSKPYISEKNQESLKNLDKILSDWGYEVIYTSAMGGHREGTGHWKGNKVDLQLKKNGRPAHLTGEQLNMLKKAGYWGPGTGALGWEPVSGQVGGGHYDLYVANGSSNGIALASADKVKLDTQDMPTTAENQYVAMNTMNETAQASAEAGAASSGGILDMLGNIDNSISSGFGNMSSGISSNDGGVASNGFAGGGSQDISVSMPNTQGGAGSSTGNVYAFGDVAKTPILYTL